MDFTDIISQVLMKNSPALAGLVAGEGLAIKALISFLKARFPHLRGNIVQSLAAGASLLLVAAQGAAAGAFAHFTPRDLLSVAAAAALVYASAVGWHESLTDRNAPVPAIDPKG